MSRKFIQITFSILLLAGMVLGLAAKDGALANALQAPAAQGTAKIEAQLLTQLNAGSADFIVMMTEQADVSAAKQLQTKVEKGQYVFDTLTATATRTQADLRTYLDSQSVDYRPFYIVNAVWVKQGTRDLAYTIAARPDVSSLLVNQTFQLEKPINPKDSTAQPNYVEPNISFIKADQAWATGYTGQGTVMAGNDTGLDITHPTILPHYRGCLNPPSCTEIDNNYNWYDVWDPAGHPSPWDDYGHGTHTTGTMVGDDFVGNQIGVAPGATTVHCKNMVGGGGDEAHFIACFEWDLAPWDLNGLNPRPDLAPDAINNSWGFGGGGNNSMRVSVDNLLAAGIVVEVSAGNEGSGCQTLRSPGDYLETFTTGSVNHANAYPGTITGFSSRGPSSLDGNYFPDFMAPGENVRSALPGNTYGYWSGTSMAGPHVTALIGLIWSANPSLKGQIDTTYSIIQQTVVPLTGQNGSNCGGEYVTGPNNDWGYGTIDALAAVNLAISYGGAGVLEGTVTDSVSGLPVAGVNVLAARQEGGAWNGTTNVSGFYQITVAAGTFDVTASHPHYVAQTANNVVVPQDGTFVQDFNLTPRGWAYGFVYDFDNGTGIAGATVTAEDASFATTDGTGYYELWLDVGEHTLTAVAPNYAPESAPVFIESGFGTQQDFELQAAVVFIPSPIDVSVPLGSTFSQPATILNRLPTAYPFVFTERDNGYLPLGGGQVKVDVKASPAAAPANTAVAVSGYQARPAGTVSVERHAGINQTNVLLLAADDDNGGYSPIRDLLLAYGDLDGVTLYDPRNSTPSLADLQNYNVVVVWANYTFADPYGIGNVLADYVDSGGKVIDLNFALDPNWGYQGRFRTEGYTAMTTAGTSFTTACLGTFDTSHPIMDGVTDVCDLYRAYGTSLTAGSYEVARWQDNELFVAAKDDGSVVTIGGYVGIYYQYTGQLPDVLHNAINFIAVPADVPWLWTEPVSGTVPADGSLGVSINFDASLNAGVSQPGNYFAELTVKGDPKVKVQVHMFVEAPENWGRLDGTVIGLGYCDQNPAALKGATVEIVGFGTLTTDDAGYYATYLEEGTYTVNVTADGHFGAATTVTVVAGGNTTQNFNLRWNQPCISEDPPTMSVTLELGANTTQQMTLTNNGAGEGTFQMSDNEKGYVPMRQGFLPAAVRPTNPDRTPSSIGRAPNAPTLSPAELSKALSAMVGEQAYAVDVYPGYNLVTFLNDNPGAWTVVAGLPNNQYFGGDFINGDFSTLYVVDYATNSLYTVDTTTGAVTLVGPSAPGGGESWTGLTGASDGTMYGVATTCGSSTLYTVDLSTGGLTTIGNITNGACIIDIAITPGGQMFGVDIVADNLISIDPATGAGTVIGSIGFNANYAQGMDFEDTSGTLYLAAYSTQGELRIADPATGNTVLVGAFPGGAEVDSLAFATGGGGDAPWLSENPESGTIPGTLAAQSAPARQVTFGEPQANPGLTTKSPAPEVLVAPKAPANPEAVLWDQPLSTVNQNAYVDQDFSDLVDYSSFLADDFTNTEAWNISSIFVPGNGWNGFSTLMNASSLTWQVYADNAGIPAGDPYSGGAIWSLSLPPTDPQVVITNGTGGLPSDVTLNLDAPLNLPAGHYWFVFYPTLDFGGNGQYGRQPADTTNDYTGQFINPGGVFGFGTEWQAWTVLGLAEQDMAFRFEGTEPTPNFVTIDVTFDAGQVALPGTYTGQVKAKTNDPVVKNYTVDVTMFVNAPQNWGQLAGNVQGLGYCDVNPAPLKGAQVQIVGGLAVETDASGNYILWLEAGTYAVEVTADGHTVGNATVVINPDHEVTIQDFDLRWLQPCMTEEPASLEVTLDLGQTATQQLTLENTGAAEGTFAVSDSDKGYTPKMAQKPLVPSGNPVVITGASTNSPVQLFKSRINANDILLISTTDVSQSVERALNELGYAYDYFAGSPWTGIDFTPYSIVLVAMDGGTVEIADVQKLRTDVIDEGKKLIFLGGTAWQPFAQGVNDYLVQNDTNNYDWQVTNPPMWTLVDSTHPLADGLPDSYNYANMSAGYYSIRVTDPDAEQVAVNGENWPAFFRKATDGDFIWFIDSVYSSYWTDANDFALLKQLISNSIEVTGGGDALWLSQDPIAGVVAPDEGEQIIDVTFDASVVTQPGIYMAEIKIKTNDPVNSKFVIPAVMNVNGPPNMGRVEGIVTSLGYCDQNPVPLKGAMVEIVDGPTLETDAAGHYSSWLVEGTYTVNVTAEDHTSSTATVVVVAQETVTQDFELRVLEPCTSVDPISFNVDVAEGYTQTLPLNLINIGAEGSAFKVSEKALSLVENLGRAEMNYPRGAAAPSSGAVPGAKQVSPANIGTMMKTLTGAPANAVELINAYLIYFEAGTPESYTNLFSESGSFFAGDFINGDFSTLYAIDYNSNTLYSIDIATGAATSIGTSTPVAGESWSGMTGAVDGTMYASSTSISNSTLYTVDLETGAATVVGSITGAACVIDIAITPEMTMYAHDICQDAIYSVDPSNGAGMLIGSTGFDANYAQGMDYEEESGVLYLTAFNNANYNAELRAVDMNTGNTILVGTFGYFIEVDSTGFATGGGNPDVPWLSENPITGTVGADSTFVIDVTFDSITYTVGTSVSANLIVKTDDNKFTIPVTMNVIAPAAPDVSFTADTVVVGHMTMFDNTSFAGIPPTTEYKWDAGDGNIFTVPTADPVFHMYATFGTFAVTLEACNVAGCDTVTHEVVVEPLRFFLPLANKN